MIQKAACSKVDSMPNPRVCRVLRMKSGRCLLPCVWNAHTIPLRCHRCSVWNAREGLPWGFHRWVVMRRGQRLPTVYVLRCTSIVFPVKGGTRRLLWACWYSVSTCTGPRNVFWRDLTEWRDDFVKEYSFLGEPGVSLEVLSSNNRSISVDNAVFTNSAATVEFHKLNQWCDCWCLLTFGPGSRSAWSKWRS